MNISQFDLNGRTAIVTGGGRGIGKGICLALAQSGANVVVAELNQAAAEEISRELIELGRESFAMITDMCCHEQIERMVRKTVEVFGNIDILVNNVGGISKGQFVNAMDMSESTWDDVINLNLKSTFLSTQAVAKEMIKEKKGSIINIASVAAFLPYHLCIPYGAAKAAVVNLTKSFANILGPYNIRVNAVAPGSIDSEGRADVYKVNPDLEQIRLKAVSLGRLGTIEEVAGVVAFLASDVSAYVSGQVLRVDGAM